MGLTDAEATEPLMLKSCGGADALLWVPVQSSAHKVQALRGDLLPDAIIQRRVLLDNRMHYLRSALNTRPPLSTMQRAPQCPTARCCCTTVLTHSTYFLDARVSHEE